MWRLDLLKQEPFVESTLIESVGAILPTPSSSSRKTEHLVEFPLMESADVIEPETFFPGPIWSSKTGIAAQMRKTQLDVLRRAEGATLLHSECSSSAPEQSEVAYRRSNARICGSLPSAAPA